MTFSEMGILPPFEESEMILIMRIPPSRGSKLGPITKAGVVAASLFLACAPFPHIFQASGEPSLPPHVSTYAFMDLGPLADVADDTAIGLSNSGYVSLSINTGHNVQASLWSHGRATDLTRPPGYLNSMLHAVNDRGVVVGWVNTSENPVDSQSTTRAFVGDARGTRVLGTLGGRDSRALGVNDAGRIVGVSNLDDRTRHAFVCDGGALKDLGVLPGGKFSTAYAVNAAGDVAGVADTSHSINHAVVWRRGKIQDLGALPGGDASCAVAVNAHGDTAGYSETSDGVHAFLCRQGRMRDLGVLKFEPSKADAINDRDEIVGASNVSAYSRHAFLWRNGAMIDLNSVIPKDAGWILSEGCAVNNAGQIVCIADRRGEPSHALLLTPVKDSLSTERADHEPTPRG